MITSNQVALYIQILAVSVLYQLSINVPKAMAVAKTINKIAVNRVEKKIFLSTSVIEVIPIWFSGGKNTAFLPFNYAYRL